MFDSGVRKVLVIAYELPPSAGGGVQRVTKLVRYLPEFGWQPYVISATPAWGATTDVTLVDQISHAQVRRLPGRHVAATIARGIAPLKSLFSRGRGSADPPVLAGAQKGSAPGRASAAPAPLSTRLARRFFVDSAEPWARSVPRAASRWNRQIRFDAVLATGPPHTTLVAGARVARALGVPYVAELRDPWSTNLGYTWPPGSRVGARSAEYEREAMAAASCVIAVSEPISAWAEDAGAIRTVVVPNGFDPSDVPRWSPTGGPLRVAFMGRFYGTTDPTPFLDGMGEALRRGGAPLLDVVGPDSPSVRQALSERGLDAHVTFHGFKPHAEALDIVASADLGLLVIADAPGAEAIYSSKLFEYLGIGIPILLVGPERGAAARLIEEAAAGIVVPYADSDQVASTLTRLAEEKAHGSLRCSPRAEVVSRFERRTLVEGVARVLDSVSRDAPRDGHAPR